MVMFEYNFIGFDVDDLIFGEDTEYTVSQR
jgi:hypothetical protein